MNMSIEELLFLASSAIILPMIAVLTVAFFTGGLKGTEETKYLALADAEEDYWTRAVPARGSAIPLARPAVARDPRGGEQG
jgi:hypothetical protein